MQRTPSIVPQFEDLFAQQVELESEMTADGVRRYRRLIARAEERGEEDNTTYGRRLIKDRIVPIARAIEAWMEPILEGKVGRKAGAAVVLAKLEPTTAAFLALRYALCGISRKAFDWAKVASDIGTAVEDEIYALEIPDGRKKFLGELIAERSSAHNKRAMYLHAQRNWKGMPERQTLDEETRRLVGDVLLTFVAQTGLIKKVTDKKREGSKWKTTEQVVATPETLAFIARWREAEPLTRPIYQPMIVAPVAWSPDTLTSDLTGGGYLTDNVRPLQLVRHPSKRYRDEVVSAGFGSKIFSALNAAQNTRYRVNRFVLDTACAAFDKSLGIGKLPLLDAAPKPPKPRDIATNAEAKLERRAVMRRWYEQDRKRMSRVLATHQILSVADRFLEFPELYFPHTYDFRGRIYPATYPLSPQGSDLCKGLLEFAHGVRLGERGLHYLMAHVAATGDYEKASKACYRLREEWTRDNLSELRDMVAEPLSSGMFRGADKPWQFLGAAKALVDVLDLNRREGALGDVLVHTPITADGTCSGIQHLAAAMRDEEAALQVNLVPADGDGERASDIYSTVAAAIERKVQADLGGWSGSVQIGGGEPVPKRRLAEAWLALGIGRATAKRPTMTFAYGATPEGYRTQILEDTLEVAEEASEQAAKRGEPSPVDFRFEGIMREGARYMADLMREAIEEAVKGPAELMAWLQECAKVALRETPEHLFWRTPDDFPVYQYYPHFSGKRVRTMMHGEVRAVYIPTEDPKPKKPKQVAGVAPNWVHSLDACHLRAAVLEAQRAGIHDISLVHDSFAVHAGHYELLWTLLRTTFVDMYQENDVVAQFRAWLDTTHGGGDALPEEPPFRTLQIGDVLRSEFAFS